MDRRAVLGLAVIAFAWVSPPLRGARGHYAGGIRLLDEGVIGSFGERRPMHATWLAFRLAVGRGNLGLALVAQALLFGWALGLLARAIGLRFWAFPGIATYAAALSLIRDYLPAVATEPLGGNRSAKTWVTDLDPRQGPWQGPAAVATAAASGSLPRPWA